MYQTSDINRSWTRRSEEGMVTEPLPGLLSSVPCPFHGNVPELSWRTFYISWGHFKI